MKGITIDELGFCDSPTQTMDRAGKIRYLRSSVCFPIINRGTPWYDSLSEVQKEELTAWYQSWLDAPETGTIPVKPDWIEVR